MISFKDCAEEEGGVPDRPLGTGQYIHDQVEKRRREGDGRQLAGRWRKSRSCRDYRTPGGRTLWRRSEAVSRGPFPSPAVDELAHLVGHV